jgi:hypothetical protein
MSKAKRYQRQYRFLHKVQRDLTEAGVTCRYHNRAVTDGTPNSPFSVFLRWSSASNGETFGELNVHVDGKTYRTFGENGQTQMGLALIKSRYGAGTNPERTPEAVKAQTEAQREIRARQFAERINPTNLGFSPKMIAIVGAIIGHDYGVRDRKGGLLSELSITSDGYVMASSTAHESGAFIGSADDLNRNLADYQFVLAGENDEDAEEFDRLYKLNVCDWRK